METKLTLKNIKWLKFAGYMFVILTIPVLIIYLGLGVLKTAVEYNTAYQAGELIQPMTNESLATLILMAMGTQIISFGIIYLKQNIMQFHFSNKDIMKNDVNNKLTNEVM